LREHRGSISTLFDGQKIAYRTAPPPHRDRNAALMFLTA
jgi:hypothetical protein